MTFNLGNLATGLTEMGKTILGNVGFYAAAQMTLHGGGCCHGSIWNHGCRHGGRPPHHGMHPNGMMMPNFGMSMAYFQTQMNILQQLMNPTTCRTTLTETAAEPVTENQDTTMGAMFEQAEIEGGNFDFAKTALADETNSAAKETKYNQAVKELGKSLLMHIDKNSGDSNGQVTLEEFMAHECKNMDETQKAQLKASLKTAFNQLDQNGDGIVDWKEMASMIISYDSLNGSYDGNITGEEFINAGTKLLNGELGQKLQSEYQRMFNSY